MTTRKVVVTSFATLILLTLPPLFLVFLERSTQEVRLPADAVTVSAPWTPLARSDSEWTPQFVGTSSELQRVYVSGRNRVVFYLAFYPPQQETKLASSQNALYLPRQWIWVSEGVFIPLVNGQSMRVRETIIRSARTSYMIWNWYWVEGKFTESEYRGKYLLARSRLFGAKKGSAAIAIATDLTVNSSEAKSILQDFLAHTTLLESSP